MKKTILLSIAILLLGYIFKDKTIFLNIKENYYVTSYFTLSICFVIIVTIIFSVKYFITTRK